MRQNLALFLVICFMTVTTFVGCGSNPQPLPPPTPTTIMQIQNDGAIVGSLAKSFLPMAGPVGAEIITTVDAICALKGSTGDPAALSTEIQALLQKLWVQIDAANAGTTATEIVVAINVLWGYIQGQVVGQDTTVVLEYLNAAVTGICMGFGYAPGPTGFIHKLMDKLHISHTDACRFCPIQ
jgi:hypothetical protein